MSCNELPPGCTTSDLPGWEPRERPEETEPIEYFPVVRAEFPEYIKVILERVRCESTTV